MLSGGHIVILLSKYSTGIKKHFDTKIILKPFPFQRYEKNLIDMLELHKFQNPCFKQFKVSFCKRANEAKRQTYHENKFF